MGSLGFGKNSYLKIFPSSCLGLGFVQVSEAQLYVSRNKRLDVGFSQRLPAGLFATGKFNRNFDVLAMCIFNEPIKEVNTTQILVLPTADGTHQITGACTIYFAHLQCTKTKYLQLPQPPENLMR
jgi:hypothetical protein